MNSYEQDIIVWADFKKGNRDAFGILFQKFYGDMLLFGRKFKVDDTLLEDSIQELFIELWQSKSQTPVVSIKAYLLKSLKYKLLRVIKRGSQTATLTDDDQMPFVWSHENFLIESQDAEDKRKQVLEAVGRLSPRQQEIVYLKYYQNLSYEEVSEIMNINYQVARNLLSQSMKVLKKILLSTLLLSYLML